MSPLSAARVKIPEPRFWANRLTGPGVLLERARAEQVLTCWSSNIVGGGERLGVQFASSVTAL